MQKKIELLCPRWDALLKTFDFTLVIIFGKTAFLRLQHLK